MISNSTIEKIKTALNITDIIGECISLKRAGVNYVGCCPFHNEDTPSFSVNSSRQIYKCFGCGKSGDIVQFIVDYKRLSFNESLEFLANRANISIEYDRIYTAVELQELKTKKESTAQMFKYAERRYTDMLWSAPRNTPVWLWLASRGINEEMVRQWGLGYAPDSQDFIAPSLIEHGWYNIGIEYGLIKNAQRTTYDAYRNRIMLPSLDRHGNINGFIGRIITDAKPKYINPPQSDIYNKSTELFGLYTASSAIREKGYAYLVEGNLDVKMLHSYGLENTVGVGGTSLTAEQVAILSRHTRNAVLIPDGDEAGMSAAEKHIDMLLSKEFRVEIVELPYGEDPDSFIRKHINP